MQVKINQHKFTNTFIFMKIQFEIIQHLIPNIFKYLSILKHLVVVILANNKTSINRVLNNLYFAELCKKQFQ